MIAQLLERLAEMFPNHYYKSRFDQYLNTISITNVADVEHWTRQYDKNHERNFV